MVAPSDHEDAQDFESIGDVYPSDATSVDELLGLVTRVRGQVSQELALPSTPPPEARNVFQSAGSVVVAQSSHPSGVLPNVRRNLVEADSNPPSPLLQAIPNLPPPQIQAIPSDPLALHNPESNRPFKCPMCPQWFSSKALLGRHFRERTDRCIPCGDDAIRLEQQLGFKQCPKCSCFFAKSD